LKTKKPGTFLPGFFFVAEPGEISNLDIIKSADKIVKLLEVFPLENQRE